MRSGARILLSSLFLLLSVSRSYGQNKTSANITLDADKTAIVTVLQQVQQQGHFRFIYNNDLLDDKRVITVHLKNATLKQLMDIILKNTGLIFEEKDNGTVVLKQAVAVQKVVGKLSGVVRDSSGMPLPGVSVTVKGKPNIGTTTDMNGGFFLETPGKDAVLVFSMVGYTPREQVLADQSAIDIRLMVSPYHLDEAVVVAFGKQKKADVVGSVTTINPSELKVPSSNLTTALAGRVSGLIAYQRSGEPGADNASFFIRGVTTFGYKKDPLILIDGVEVTTTDLARLQVDDIANFSILKDATATALYGARGANGVILIATKQGKEGRPTYSVRFENSLSEPTQNIKLADPVTYMKLADEATLTRNPLGITPYSQEKIDNTIAGTNKYAYPATDWMKMLFKDYTMNQRADANVSGGASVARYYVSASFSQDNGVLKVPRLNNFNNNIDLKTYSIRSNVDVNLTRTTLLTTRVSGSFSDYTGPIAGGTAVYNEIMHSNPVMFPAYYEPDAANAFTHHILFGNAGAGTYANPYADMVKGYKQYNTSTVNAQAELRQQLDFLTQGLSFNAMANTSRYAYYDISRSYTPFYYSLGSYDKATGDYTLNALNPDAGTEYLSYPANGGTRLITTSVYFQGILNYNRAFKKHGISGSLVYQAQNSVSGDFTSLETSLPSRNLGLSGRATYNYDQRYYAEFNFGYNGSERFDIKHRFGFFPSAGIAWNVSNEKFWDNGLRNTITNLKLRATYGLVGNDAIGSAQDRFFYMSQVNMTDGSKAASFGSNVGSMYTRNGITVLRYANPDITWEVAHETNVGFDMSLWNKLNVTLDAYRTYRSNILMVRASIPTTMGLSDIPSANIGAATSKGIDASVDYNVTVNKNWWIQGRANFTLAQSRYDKYEEPAYTDEPWLSRKGYSLSQTWGYVAERLFIDDKDVANSPMQTFGTYGAGDIKYRDINGDGQITALDKVPIGFPTDPEMVYGFGVSVGYRSFDVSAFFQGQSRSSFILNSTTTAPFAGDNALLKAYADHHWSEDNRDIYALWPRLSPDVNVNDAQPSTWWVRNGKFLRLKQLEIGYSLPKSLMDRFHMKSFRFYLNGSNLFNLSTFKLWDIEMAGNGLGYPLQRVVNLGLQTSF
ncbi:SusC/RagA family TonB-linked outer membrane protein [Chitinophaga parva]|uniref:SusC/RagA family TonB-linked outer membrane protein n=2 Tax=Chitinophaga parva TaxID=2169414 RepID=A0A2T7BFA2_9BACT|nr:SusC/RagA family TonB-linked outer membrane protein [Chitinophaga parva]